MGMHSCIQEEGEVLYVELSELLVRRYYYYYMYRNQWGHLNKFLGNVDDIVIQQQAILIFLMQFFQYIYYTSIMYSSSLYAKHVFCMAPFKLRPHASWMLNPTT